MHTKYKLWFFIMPAALLAGICMGSISATKLDTAAFFKNAAESLASPTLCTDSFGKALKQNMGCAALLFIFGTSIIGAIPSGFLLAVRGFSIGQTVGATVSAFGFRGFWAAFLGILPHNLFYVPFMCLLGICSAGFSPGSLQNGNGKNKFFSYLFTVLLLSIPVFLGCLIEGYISAPLFRRILTPML